jgi:hypothetical protein
VRLPCSHLYQNANAKSVFLTLRQNIGDAGASTVLARTLGIQGEPLARFLVTSCRVTRSNIKRTNRSARGLPRSVSVRLRNHGLSLPAKFFGRGQTKHPTSTAGESPRGPRQNLIKFHPKKYQKQHNDD